MPTVRVVDATHLAPERVLSAAHNFSERRAKVFPAVSVKRTEVHELGAISADVTRAPRAGAIVLTRTSTRFPGAAGNSMQLPDGGSRVEMSWIREFRSGPRGRLCETLSGRIGDRVFDRYARDVLRNLEQLEAGA